MPEISKINVNGTSYNIKDEATASAVEELKTQISTGGGIGQPYYDEDGTAKGEIFRCAEG